MFREADYKYPAVRRHPVPTPANQLLSQNAKLDDSAAASRQNYNHTDPNKIEAVPAKWDAVYDPTHPNADWSGLVAPEFTQQRKHCRDHASQRSGIVQTEHGLVSAEEVTKFRQKDPKIAEMKNATHFSMEGAGGDGDKDRWMTAHRRFEAHEGTSIDQLTLQRRTKGVKMIPDPAQARTSSSSSSQYVSASPRVGYATDSPRVGMAADSPRDGSQQQQHQPSARPGRTNFADMAKDIASNINVPAPKPHAKPPVGKTMLLENYNPTPGYSGRRKLV